MTDYREITQEIINAINGKQDAVTHLVNERTLESHFDAVDNFDRAINVLAMNNKGDRYTEVENEDGTSQKIWHRQKVSADKRELWNGKLQYTMYKSESAKYEPKKAHATASIKASIKNLPQARQYNTTVDASKEFKPSLKSTKGYRVAGYHFFQKAIVLDIVDADKESREYLLRNEENNEEIIHLVFRYMPFDRFGRRNKYDGIAQLRNFLQSQKFIVSQNPASLKDALNILVGYTVEFPSILSYNYAGADDSHVTMKDGKKRIFKRSKSNSDLLTVYTVFGEFESFEREFSDSKSAEYQSISEFSPVDADCFEYEDLQQVICNPSSNFKQGSIIKHECHKEFAESLPLAYNHISAIFD